MRQVPALILLLLHHSAHASEWKALSCVVEAPDPFRGHVLTIYFNEFGRAKLFGHEYPATVSDLEVNFCRPGRSGGVTDCYVVSRMTGRFSAQGMDPAAVAVVAGSCVAGVQPKF